MDDLIEPKIDEQFVIDGFRYKCVKTSANKVVGCEICDLYETKDCDSMNCIDFNRKDNQDVHFELLSR